MNHGRPRSRLICVPIRTSFWRRMAPSSPPIWESTGRSPVHRFRQALVIFTNASTSGNCGATKPRESTAIAESTYLDQERNLLFNLQSAFVQVLQAKAFLENAKENCVLGSGTRSVSHAL